MPGLYFCGFEVSPTGQLRKIGQEARKIASRSRPASRRQRAARDDKNWVAIDNIPYI